MANCGTNQGKFMGSAVMFNGQVASGHPPPTVSIDIKTEDGSCGIGERRTATINLSGELICCDPQTKIDARETLVTQFSKACGDFSAGAESFKGARVQSFDISSSDYLSNVSYSASLTWEDPNFSGGAPAVKNATDSVQASETDDSITVTHVVSATGLPPQECDECDCDFSEAKSFVNSKISSSCPTPKTIDLPSGVDSCEETVTESDSNSCYYSKTKTWTFDKKKLLKKQSPYGDEISHSQCIEEQTDQFGQVTTTISGNVDVDAENCDISCGDLYSKVVKAVNAEADKAAQQYNGPFEPNISKSFNDAEPPSGSYTVTLEPPPTQAGATKKEDVSVSVSFSGDGVGSVSVSGSVSNLLPSSGAKSLSSKCLCEGLSLEEDKFEGQARSYYEKIKQKLGDALDKLAGPCSDEATLKKENSDIRDCEDGSISFSMNFTDKKESDQEWSWSLDLSRPLEKVSVVPTMGGGYCVTKTGNYSDGSISVSGNKNQNCPDDGNIDPDSFAKDLGAQAAGGNPLKDGAQNCSTTTSGEDDLSFNKTYNFSSTGKPSRALNITGIQSKKNMNS